MSVFSEDEADSTDGYVPAVLQRPTKANYVVQERITMETLDREDHTFCGIVFDVQATDKYPVEFLEITSVAVRGELGSMTVWFTPDTYAGKCRDNSHWTLLHEEAHAASFHELVPLELTPPVQLKRGEKCGLFVHSTLPGDSAVVYDNQRPRRQRCAKKQLLTIHTGMAALDNRPFGDDGMWGEGWRLRREFVGRISVGVCWKLWNPETNNLFPMNFQAAALCLFLCAGRPESPLHRLSDAILLYVLNMCRWDWFEDELQDMEEDESHRPPMPTWPYSDFFNLSSEY